MSIQLKKKIPVKRRKEESQEEQFLPANPRKAKREESGESRIFACTRFRYPQSCECDKTGGLPECERAKLINALGVCRTFCKKWREVIVSFYPEEE